MSESLINTFGRRCFNCVHWDKMPVGEHTGYCDEMGKHFGLRLSDQEKEHVKMKCKTTDFMVCSAHETDEENRLRLHKELKDNRNKFEPKS